MKLFQMIINHFLFPKLIPCSFAAQFLCFDTRDIKKGNREQQIARDGKLTIYFKKQFHSFSNERNAIKFS